jgi:hypothetical protein
VGPRSGTAGAASGMSGPGSPVAASALEVAAVAPGPGAAGVAPIVLPALVMGTDVLESPAAMIAGSVASGAVVASGRSLTMGGASLPAATAPIAVGTSGAATAQAHTKLRTAVRGARRHADAEECRARPEQRSLDGHHPSLSAAGTKAGPPRSAEWSNPFTSATRRHLPLFFEKQAVYRFVNYRAGRSLDHPADHLWGPARARVGRGRWETRRNRHESRERAIGAPVHCRLMGGHRSGYQYGSRRWRR